MPFRRGWWTWPRRSPTVSTYVACARSSRALDGAAEDLAACTPRLISRLLRRHVRDEHQLGALVDAVVCARQKLLAPPRLLQQRGERGEGALACAVCLDLYDEGRRCPRSMVCGESPIAAL